MIGDGRERPLATGDELIGRQARTALVARGAADVAPAQDARLGITEDSLAPGAGVRRTVKDMGDRDHSFFLEQATARAVDLGQAVRRPGRLGGPAVRPGRALADRHAYAIPIVVDRRVGDSRIAPLRRANKDIR